MSVKIKIFFSFVFILFMIFLQSLLTFYFNKRQYQLTEEAITIYRSTLTLKDRTVDATNLQSDLNRLIINKLDIPERNTWVRLSCVLISKRLLEWHDQFVKSDEYEILENKQKLKIMEMNTFLKNIEETINLIRDEKNYVKRVQYYERDIVNFVSIIQNIVNEVIDINTTDFLKKNRSIADYSNTLGIYRNIILVVSFLFVLFLILYANKVLLPIKLLTDGVRRLKSGDLSENVEKISNDEFGLLTDQFNEMIHEISAHRDHMEELVEKRTNELSKANTQLKNTFDELQKTHNDLVEVRKVSDMDMKMAENVQCSFFQKKAPKSDAWDIDFIFKPMSGVSGDMYDFYTLDENNIIGLSLMDVSGHGISSGLVTMIAKSFAYRNFMNAYSRKLKLNETLVRLNSDLIKEMKNMDQYLTGVILKFQGDIVEYVNSGHPDLLIKKMDTAKTYIVAPGKEEFKSKFLGVDAMRFSESEVRSLKFKMNRGDLLCLYSDCLIESNNDEGKDFGVQGLINCLNTAGKNFTSKKVINHIMSNLYRWVGSDKLKDDLTIIVIRKK